MSDRLRWGLVFLTTVAFQNVYAEYPDMTGVWTGTVRIVESSLPSEGRVAAGGAVISKVEMKLTIEHQDGETFIGKTRSSRQNRSDPSTNVWGTIRSNGEEALFVTSNGGRGQLWFESKTQFEFCITNMLDNRLSAYCSTLKKQI